MLTQNRAIKIGGLTPQKCCTSTLPLHGNENAVSPNNSLSVYGSDIHEIRKLEKQSSDWALPLHPALPYIRAEVVWGARNEMARTVADILARRTRALFLDARASIEAAPMVASLLAVELGRDSSWQREQIRSYQELAIGYLPGSAKLITS